MLQFEVVGLLDISSVCDQITSMLLRHHIISNTEKSAYTVCTDDSGQRTELTALISDYFTTCASMNEERDLLC